MENYNIRKSEQLGMNAATASNRLKKLIMFLLLKELGRNVCYRCGKPINSTEELSIEHKIPWMHSENAADLFFDYSNIAFSHLKCNVAAARKNIKYESTYLNIVQTNGFSNSKITKEDVLNIRLLGRTMKGVDIAQLYGVNKHVIYRILKGKSFLYVK